MHKFDKEMYDYLIFNIYVYRAYGYVAIEKYEHALDDFRRAKRITPFALDKATRSSSCKATSALPRSLSLLY